MRIVLLGDTHAGARGDNPHLNEFFFRFWNNIFFPALKTHNIDRVVHLGDVVDRRKFINFAIWHKWQTEFFDRLESMKMPMDMLCGNHDVYYRNTNRINALNELVGKYTNIRIFQEPETVEYDGLPVALIPWINSGNHDAAMEFIKNTPAPVVFGHLEVRGFEMDKGVVCLEGVDRTIFDRFDSVLSGHFHHKSSDGTIHYLGNQYQITWADFEDTRGFHIFDTKTRALTFIENPYRLFYRLVYNDQEQTFEDWKNQDLSYCENSYVKIVVEHKQNPYLFNTVMDNLYKIGPIDITVVEDHTEWKANTSSNTVNQAEDTPTIIRKSVDAAKLPASVDPVKLKNILQGLYMEALNEMAAQ